MQILTKCFIVCALAATIAPFSSRGADTDAQTKAREALRQKMSELEAQPVVTNPAPSSTAPTKKPKTRPAPAPVVTKPAESVKTLPEPAPASVRPTETTPAPAPAPAPVVKTTPPPKSSPVAKTSQNSGPVTASRPDSERIAKAREALEAKMKEINAQGGQPTVAVQPPATQPSASTPAPASREPEVTSTSRPSASTDANETLPAPPPRKRSPEAETKQAQQSKRPKETRPTPESRPMYALPKGPPPPVSDEKVQKLNALLQRYEADQITPDQYHAERAKILAGQ